MLNFDAPRVLIGMKVSESIKNASIDRHMERQRLWNKIVGSPGIADGFMNYFIPNLLFENLALSQRPSQRNLGFTFFPAKRRKRCDPCFGWCCWNSCAGLSGAYNHDSVGDHTIASGLSRSYYMARKDSKSKLHPEEMDKYKYSEGRSTLVCPSRSITCVYHLMIILFVKAWVGHRQIK